jgi:trehalose/maltose transport system substrate-binding protein
MENKPDREWDDRLVQKFRDLTGIDLELVRMGNDTSAALPKYLSEFREGRPKADVYEIDIVWPGILSKYAEDLRPDFVDLHEMAATLVQNDTLNGKLVAVPYFIEISLLYYRQDLLKKYDFAKPPESWRELEQQAKRIMDGERVEGRDHFWGFLWQGAASEALTCNALEWQVSEGGGSMLTADGTVSVEHELTATAWQRGRRWVGTLSPPDVTHQLEDDSLRIWKQGDAAFMRNWPYAYVESAATDSTVRNNVGVTLLPMGEGRNARHADTLGGFQLMVSNETKHRDAAIQLVRFLTSPEVQKLNAVARGYAPVRLETYDDPAVTLGNPLFRAVREALVNGAITRPSTAAGDRYDAVSAAYFGAARSALTGQEGAPEAVVGLDKKLHAILSN